MPVNDQQYAEIMKVFDERQIADLRDLKRRQAEVYARLPQLEDCDGEIRALAVERAEKALEGDNEAAKKASDKAEELLKEREEILLASGYASDETEMRFFCADCRDTGYIKGVPCVCLKKEIAKVYADNSNLSRVFQEENFGTFTDRYYTDEPLKNGKTVKEHMMTVLSYCKKYAEEFGEKSPNVLFIGKAGVGKTFFARCIASELLQNGTEVTYQTATELSETLKAGLSFDRTQEQEEKERQIKECELLIIDDLGTECPTSRTASLLFSCLEYRALKEKPTLITTNLSADDIRKEYSERIFSRIFGDWEIVYMHGDDIRRKR